MSCSRIQHNLFRKHLLIAEDKEFTKGTGKLSKQSYSVCCLKDHPQIIYLVFVRHKPYIEGAVYRLLQHTAEFCMQYG